jgi:dipeptidyl aminopeptidase/acylaminoacyl peptidase
VTRALRPCASIFLVLAVLAPAAQAAFPGGNGAVGYAFSTNTGGDIGPLFQTSGLQAERLGTERERFVVRCERTDGVPSGGDCTVTDFRSPSYSADGTRIVFDAGAQIGLVDADGGPVTLLPAVTADDGDPAFSPSGRRIVFTGTNERGGTDVFVHRLGSPFARPIVLDARQPAWSSRNEIAYVRDGNVYVANRTGQRRRLVTSGVAPDWSPGGRRLVFVRPAPRNIFAIDDGRVFTIGARGRGLRRAVPRVDDASSPIWSPNGRWIAFEGAFSGVWAQRLGSRAEAQIVEETQVSGESGSVNYFDPAWRPRRAR